MEIRNPATGDVIRTVDEDTEDSVASKVARATQAQSQWAERPFSDRLAVIKAFAQYIGENADSAAKIMAEEIGKPFRQGRGEVLATVKRIQWFVEHSASAIEAEEVFSDDGMREVITYEPLGTIANVSAWNFPYFVGSNVFIPGLLTGNAVAYKPSEFAAGTGEFIAEGLWKSGVPRDVFALIQGAGEAGKALLEQEIHGVFFTGSYGTGRRIAESLAGRMLRTQFELGGKDPAYVCDDMDPKAAAESLGDGAFYNCGQSCCAVERIYVHESIYQEFVDHLAAFASGLVVGDPMDEKTYLGPLTRPQQMAVLEEQISEALSKGGKLLAGGEKVPGDGAFFKPTVVGDASKEMSLMKDESFGPVIGVQPVSSDEEAVALMNDTQYGLTASVHTLDESRAKKILAAMNTGTVYWNCCDRVSPYLPWTGRKHSGIGSTLSKIGVQAFVQPKAWHLKSASA